MDDVLGAVRAAKLQKMGLNPCSNGRCFGRTNNLLNDKEMQVLILVLMDDVLGVQINLKALFIQFVLILVLMDDVLGGRYSHKRR